MKKKQLETCLCHTDHSNVIVKHLRK